MTEKLEKVLKLVLEMQEMPVGELRRGPFLAVVEIEKRRLLLRRKFGGEDQIKEQSVILSDSIRAFFKRLVRVPWRTIFFFALHRSVGSELPCLKERRHGTQFPPCSKLAIGSQMCIL